MESTQEPMREKSFLRNITRNEEYEIGEDEGPISQERLIEIIKEDENRLKDRYEYCNVKTIYNSEGRGSYRSSITYEGVTLLHIASQAGYEEAVVKILESKFSDELVNAAAEFGNTPLHGAAFRGSLECVNLLLGRGASVNAADKGKSTPLHFAADQGYLPIMEVLVQKGAKIDEKDKYGGTPLSKATFRKHLLAVKFLVEHGADVNLIDSYGRSLLYNIYCYGKPEIADYLISKGATISEEDKEKALTEAKFSAEQSSSRFSRSFKINAQQGKELADAAGTEGRKAIGKQPSVKLEEAEISESIGPATPTTSMKR